MHSFHYSLSARYATLAVLLFSIILPGCESPSESAPKVLTGRHRVYYIAAEEVDWNYAPAGENLVAGRPFDEMEEAYVKQSPSTIGSVYKKALYIEYTDSTFTTKKPRSADDAHLGLLGPIIRAEVGDTVDVFYLNRTGMTTSVHPHGVEYKKSSEGSPTNDSTDGAGAVIDPGTRYHYIWTVPERSGPGPNDPSSIIWAYHSHIREAEDQFAGLIGAIIITRHGEAKEDGRPKDVDREFVTLFMVIDENQSPYLAENTTRFIPNPSGIDQEVFEEGNLKHAMNGYLYGNMPMPTMHLGERVRWYLIGMGNEVDVHTAHWHGNTLLEHGSREDVVMLAQAIFKEADMVPDAAGIWQFHCHVTDHMLAGMMERYQVLP